MNLLPLGGFAAPGCQLDVSAYSFMLSSFLKLFSPYLPGHWHLQVCDVLWCMTHKVAGSFGDLDFKCREFTNIDVYRLAFFDTTSPRPAICQQYDPVSAAHAATWGFYCCTSRQLFYTCLRRPCFPAVSVYRTCPTARSWASTASTSTGATRTRCVLSHGVTVAGLQLGTGVPLMPPYSL